MISFKEWLSQQEMWFSPEAGVQDARRKPNKGYEGNELPKSLAPKPPNQVPGTTGYLGLGKNAGAAAAGPAKKMKKS